MYSFCLFDLETGSHTNGSAPQGSFAHLLNDRVVIMSYEQSLSYLHNRQNPLLKSCSVHMCLMILLIGSVPVIHKLKNFSLLHSVFSLTSRTEHQEVNFTLGGLL